MKKYTILAFVILLIILAGFCYVIYGKVNENKGDELQNKVLSEIRYIETQIITIANSLNNLSVSNYKVSITEAKDQSKSSEENNIGNNSSSEISNSISTSSTTKNEQYNLEPDGILQNSTNTNIDWKKIQKEAEKLYTSAPTITLDLYQTNTNNDDILNFNKNLDNLTKALSDTDKQKSLEEVANLYSYLPKFLENIDTDNIYYTTISTKSYVERAYSQLDLQEWDKMDAQIQEGINNYAELLKNADIEGSKSYTINKTYVMLNELKNAINIKDREVFLIKYKNILEEMNTL